MAEYKEKRAACCKLSALYPICAIIDGEKVHTNNQRRDPMNIAYKTIIDGEGAIFNGEPLFGRFGD